MQWFDEDEIQHELYVHLLWSTAGQKSLIPQSVEQGLCDYLRDLALTAKCHLIGGCVSADHIQMVIKFSPETILSDLIQDFKLASTWWLRTHFHALRDFDWQKSDFSFTVDFEEVGELVENTKNSKSFEQEIYYLLDQNKIHYDPLEVLE